MFLFSPIPVPFQQSSNDDGWDPVRALLSLSRPPLNPAGQTQEKYGMEKPTNLITPLHFLYF